ncbi:MAG: hypothetical protein EBZ53_04695 [Verrucomicrobia bacterium]|nr:hypothetical protein [Verrucomicrobiota bacterium]
MRRGSRAGDQTGTGKVILHEGGGGENADAGFFQFPHHCTEKRRRIPFFQPRQDPERFEVRSQVVEPLRGDLARKDRPIHTLLSEKRNQASQLADP